MTPPTGVLLMTFGSAQTADEVPGYLRSVRGGGDPDPDVVAEFQRRYALVGWSPLVRITLEQGEALQRVLDETRGEGRFVVAVGMLHSEPHIDEAAKKLAAAGVDRVIGIVLSPQYSAIIMGGYDRALAAAAERSLPGVDVGVAGPWHTVQSFVDELAGRVQEALGRFPEPDRVPIIFTAHSLPQAVVQRDTNYIEQLVETIDLVAARAGLDASRWQFAYQSAGHTPEEWLKPDLKDLLPGLRANGHEDVLVVPIQFLADHLEILYDIDVAAREEAEEAGMRFHRIDLPNTSPVFIRALAEVVDREERRLPAPARGPMRFG
jgi:protoporphyrin/coproporphyrin ferrochelatase